MRLAIVSDVHGNLPALEAVAADLERVRPDLVVHGGDLALHGARPAECVDRIRELGWPGVVGNTDEVTWKGVPPGRPIPPRSAEWTAWRLGAERVAWLRGLPAEWRDGDRVALVHASPGDLWTAPPAGADAGELDRAYRRLAAALAVYCHIHVPYVRELEGLTVANPGSVGLPFDGDRRASYLLVEGGRASVRRVEYDFERAVAEVAASEHPAQDWILARLKTARP